MPIAATKARRWDYEEYTRLADLGFFRGQNVELIGGRIIQMAPQRDLHAAALELGRRALERGFGPNFWVRQQLPLHMGKWSGPEPDLAVVSGGPRDYIGTGHPTSALLIVEISDTTLRYDRRIKASIYAKYNIADYWIVNLIDRQVEVWRNPVPDPRHRFGYRYASPIILRPGESMQPLTMSVSISVDDVLP